MYESALLKRRNTEAEESSETTKAVILWGSLFGVVLVALAGTLISRSLASQIGAAVHHIQTSSAELQSAANQQATGAKEQATAMNEISTTISELLATLTTNCGRALGESPRSRNRRPLLLAPAISPWRKDMNRSRAFAARST